MRTHFPATTDPPGHKLELTIVYSMEPVDAKVLSTQASHAVLQPGNKRPAGNFTA